MIELGFLVEPFQRIAFDTVGHWYIATLIGMMALSTILVTLDLIDQEMFTDASAEKLVFLVVIIAPIFEEVVFRILPFMFTNSLWILIIGSIVWAMLHGERAAIQMVSVPIYVKLIAGGFFTEAVALHMTHNAIFVALFLVARRLKYANTGRTA